MSGVVSISFDTELGWGSIENGLWRAREQAGVFELTRPRMRELLRVMDELEIPGTWAIVGGLLPGSKERRLDHLAPDLQRMVRGALSEASEKSFRGDDLVEMLLATRAGHELGVHTYSHTRFDHPSFTAAAAETDLVLAREALGPTGGPLDCLVFPRNREGHLAAVAAAGIRVVRGAPEAHGGALGRTRLARALAAPPPVRVERAEPNLVRVRGSMLYKMGRSGRGLYPFLVERRARLGMRAAARGGSGLHIWLHPFNLGESASLAGSLIRFLRAAAAERDRGNLSFAVLGAIAATTNAAPPLEAAPLANAAAASERR